MVRETEAVSRPRRLGPGTHVSAADASDRGEPQRGLEPPQTKLAEEVREMTISLRRYGIEASEWLVDDTRFGWQMKLLPSYCL